jgi:arsenate reductase
MATALFVCLHNAGRSQRYVDWELPDPKGPPVDEVRALRDDIAQRVQRLAAELDGAGTASVPDP